MKTDNLIPWQYYCFIEKGENTNYRVLEKKFCNQDGGIRYNRQKVGDY